MGRVWRVIGIVVASAWVVALLAAVAYAWLAGGVDVSAGTP